MIKLAFIINPISGLGRKNIVPRLIQEYLDHSKYSFQIFYTEYRGHAFEISKRIVEEKSFQSIVIVGGDGSINEVGRALIYTDVSLGIIPAGSGNGFAKHFLIPCDVKESIKCLNKSIEVKIDAGKINSHYFFATCGLGFDARVTHEFDQLSKRGFMGYVKAITAQLKKCGNIKFSIDFEGKNIVEESFVLTVANTSQYGNDFTISPRSKANDQKLELVSIKKPKWSQIPEFLFRAFTKNLNSYKGLKSFSSSKFQIETENKKGHVDGDPILLEKINTVEVIPSALTLLIQSEK
jgi:YegS/Rv2252/BmrU family lipid kinase